MHLAFQMDLFFFSFKFSLNGDGVSDLLHLQPRRSRSASSFVSSTSSSMVFRPDVIFVLLRKTYKESDLGTVCRMVMDLS